MATDPTGEVRHTADGYAARITWRGGKDRRTFALPHASDQAAAKERANVLAGMAAQFRRAGVIDDPRTAEIAKLAASSSPSTLEHVLQVAGELVGGELEVVAPKSSTDPTVRDIAEKWLPLRRAEAERGDVAASTVAANAEHLEHHILPVLGDTTVALLATEPARLRHFVTRLRDTPRTRAGARKTRVAITGTKLSSYRVRNVCATLSKLLEDALAEGWVQLTANPMRHAAVKLPRAETLAKGEVLFVPREDAARMLDDVQDAERRDLYLFDFTTGLDLAEISGLDWRHLGLDQEIPTVRVERCFTKEGTYGPTKRPSRVRQVPLHPLAVEMLRRRAERWATLFGRAPIPDDAVFPGVAADNDGKPRPVPQYWFGAAENLRADLERAGCCSTRNGFPLTAKSMRRSFASWLHEVGVEEAIISRLMGHSARTVTGRHYTASDLRRLYDAVCNIKLELNVRGDAGEDGPAMAPETSNVGAPIECNDSESLGASFEIRTRDLRFTKGWGDRDTRGPNSDRSCQGKKTWRTASVRWWPRVSLGWARRATVWRRRGMLHVRATRHRHRGARRGWHSRAGPEARRVIGSARQIAVYAFGEPVDMRKSFNTLSALVVALGKDVLSGHFFLFVSRDRKRAKVLFFDGTGLCLFAKRMAKGRFAPVYERACDGIVRMTPNELALFIEGSAAVRVELSPPLLTLADLTPRWPQKKDDGLKKKSIA